VKIELTVNGRRHALDLPPLMRLLDALRGPLGLTGAKEGCGEGECGSCAVLLDGEPVNACLVAVGQCHGREVTTVEGLGAPAGLDALQRAMIDQGGAQCGICTPGMLLAAEALLRDNPDPSAVEVRVAISGNLCRCTGYERIVQSILEAARRRQEAAPRPRARGKAPA
jgi:carbon-monoxide dehydrogenase small subunit